MTATAEDITITFGNNDILSFSITFTGFVNDDDALGLDEVPTASSAATSASDAGAYDILVTGGSDNNYNFNNVNGVFTIEKADQVITFPTIGEIDLATASSVLLSASSDVDLPIQYSIVEGEDFTTISGTELTFSGTGNVTVEASQTGSSNYNAAASVSQSFTVIDSRKQDQTITFTSLTDATYGDAPITLDATSNSGLGVSFSIVSGDDASIVGNTLTILGAGTVEIEARQDGNDGFNAAEPVVQSLVIDAASVTITPDDKEIALGDALPTFTITYAGFVNGEDESVPNALPVVSSPTANIATEGEYDISVTQDATAANYVFANETGTLSVVRPLSASKDLQIVIYPNPVVDMLSISGLLESASYEIISLDGKVVDSGYTTDKINLSDIKRGTYVLQLKDTSQQVIRRELLIKK
ncbi:MAG: T9SS type A sorting domain-containing protein [Ekhidna sp.]|nr:T9SS type A sorting domain-containing protein [Ekhidna sp.]